VRLVAGTQVRQDASERIVALLQGMAIGDIALRLMSCAKPNAAAA
jgi:hypothetical protein